MTQLIPRHFETKAKKTIELRKSMPKINAGDTVSIYHQPKKDVTATIATVITILKVSPKAAWTDHKARSELSNLSLTNSIREVNSLSELSSSMRFN